MSEDKIKIDLFDQDFEKEKSKMLRRFKQYPRQRFLPVIRIPLEYTVIISIGVLLFVVVAYAVGVETGKRVRVKDAGVGRDIPIQLWDEVQGSGGESVGFKKDEMNSEQTPLQEEKDVNLANEEKSPLEVEPSLGEVSDVSETVYTLQLASFKNEGTAKDEAKDLKERGLVANMAKRGGWYQVYTEGYRTIDEAKEAQKTLTEEYKDCYIKKTNR
ncbi:MAG: SPOR domain-containing protein [Candidatus Aadella gelida]|nr:SPOR domain-containing protein [Candidatus Aadella gelida]